MKSNFKRIEIYRGRVIITNGNVFMMFHSNQRYKSLNEIRLAIDKREALQ